MSNRTKGMLCIIISALCFAIMNTFVRLAGDIPSMQKAFFRNFVSMIFSLIVLKRSGIPFQPPKRSDWIPLLARSFFGTVGLCSNFYAVDHLALSDASMLNKMSPFFAIVCSLLILGERLNAVQTAGVAIAFLGSLLVIKPNPSNMTLVPALIGLLGGMCAGIAYTVVRYMSKRSIPSSLIVFVFSAFSCLVCFPFLVFLRAPMTGLQLIYLLLAGVFACGGQLCITSAYQFAPARDISVYDYTQIVFAALLGWFLFAQLPDLLSLLGYIVICGTGIFMFLYQRRELRT